MTLTNLLLFFILVTLATYTFMPWKGIDKGGLQKIISQWFVWTLIFGIVIFLLVKLNLVI
jgi:hypothetical protein